MLRRCFCAVWLDAMPLCTSVEPVASRDHLTHAQARAEVIHSPPSDHVQRDVCVCAYGTCTYGYIDIVKPMACVEWGESDPFYATLKICLEILTLPVTHFLG